MIVHSELLLSYLQQNYPGLYLISSTTKVLTDFQDLERELSREAFRYVVPDFRLNKAFTQLGAVRTAENKSGISVQRVLLVWLPGQEAML